MKVGQTDDMLHSVVLMQHLLEFKSMSSCKGPSGKNETA